MKGASTAAIVTHLRRYADMLDNGVTAPPGTTIHGIAKATGVPLGALRTCLYRLRKSGVIELVGWRHTVGRSRRVYAYRLGNGAIRALEEAG